MTDLQMPYDSFIWPDAVEQMRENTRIDTRRAFRWMERFGQMLREGRACDAQDYLYNIADNADMSVQNASRALFDLHSRHLIKEDLNTTDAQSRAQDWLDCFDKPSL